MSDLKKSNKQRRSKKGNWSKLSDVQKQQSLLNSPRLLDHKTFVQRFKSWEAPDAELIENYCEANNNRAFAKLYERHKPEMLAYLYGILHNWEDAKDVLQNAWLSALEYFDKRLYREEQHFSFWFKRICSNKIREWRRDKRRFFYGSGQLPDHADTAFNADECLENSQGEMLLQKAINRLPESERQVVILRIYQDMDFYTIAVMRHITANSARGIYCKALKKLKKALC